MIELSLSRADELLYTCRLARGQEEQRNSLQTPTLLDFRSKGILTYILKR